MKKFLCLTVIVSLLISVMAGCANAKDKDGQSVSQNSSEKKKVVIHLNGMDEEQKMISAMEEIQKMEKYKNIEFEFHGRDADFDTKVPVSISGGAQVDIIIVANPMLQQQYADEGLIQPLDDLIAKAKIDFKKEFGNYAENAKNNGKIYIVPHNVTRWALYYNKDIFDAAKVPYPSVDEPMTWDEYRETAKKITKGEGADKKYGAFYLPWGTFTYGDAIMALGGGEHFYTSDGLSNINDPVFARSMERVWNMMHVDKSMPTHANVMSAKVGPTDYMNGSYGMAISGGWIASWAMDFKTYPRKWKLGIAPMPVDAGTTPKSWGIVNGFGIPVTAADPALSLEIAMDLVALSAKYADTTESAIRTVAQDNLFVEAGKALAGDGITLDDLRSVFTRSDMILVNEKIIGPANVAYEKVYMEEVEKYLVKEQDVATTIKNIKTRGDKVIKEEGK